MCTVSWLPRVDNKRPRGYQLFFNRDEQRTRAKAIAPECIVQDGVRVLMPIDPDGGGSWISVNEKGLSLCLLNFYQGKMPTKALAKGNLISRGQLLRGLSPLPSIDVLQDVLDRTDLTRYAPFTLIALSSMLEDQGQLAFGYQWTGSELRPFTPENFMTSSSVKFDEVSATRHRLFKTLTSSADPEALHQFHHAHDGDKNYRSVCMHREDAKTVSFSHIIVESGRVVFNYQDGSPCEEGERFTVGIDVL